MRRLIPDPILIALVIVSLCLCTVAFSQMSPDQAMQRLHDRQLAAATQPSDPAAQISELKSVIAAQAKQIDDLKSQISNLKSQLREALDPALPAANTDPNDSTFTSRAQQWIKGRNFSPEDAQAEIKRAVTRDRAIDAFGAQQKIPPDMIAQMHAGNPKPGMPEAALELFLNLKTLSETEDGKTVAASPVAGLISMTWQITISGGKVTEVEDLPVQTTIEGGFGGQNAGQY